MDKNKKTEYEDLFKDYSSVWQSANEEMSLDLQMHLGAHFTDKQITQAKLTGRTLYPFNKTSRQVDLIHGYEIRNRHVLKIGPVDKNDDEAASQHTGLVMQQMNSARGYDWQSDCFKWGSLVTGSNLMEIYIDREGNIHFGRLSYSSFLLDPALWSSDLSDCRNILTGRWLHEDIIKALLPTEADKIDKIAPADASRWDHQPLYARYDYMRLYEQRWYMKTGFEDRVLNRLTGEELSFDDFKREKVSGGAKAANDLIDALRTPAGMPILTKFKQPFKSIGLDIFVDGELVWDGPNPLGLDEHNFIWLNGEWCPEMERSELKLRSLTRKLRDPQHARDKRLNQALDAIESSIQAGKRIKEGALVNPKAAYKSGQGAVLIVDKDHQGPLSEAVDQFSGPGLAGGVLELIEILDKEETAAAGMNEEILGNDDKDIPGILHQYRTGQALTGQGGIFQNFRRAKWQLGIKLVKANQIWMSPEDVERRIGKRPAPGFYDPDFVRFDCNPCEGLLTDSQRQLYYLELKELYQMFPQLIPASFVIANAPVQQSAELLQAVKQKEQVTSQMAQAELQTKQMLDQVMLQQANLDAAKAQGELAGIPLDQAKAMTEIAKLNAEPQLGMIDKYLQLLTIMQVQQQLNQPVGAAK